VSSKNKTTNEDDGDTRRRRSGIRSTCRNNNKFADEGRKNEVTESQGIAFFGLLVPTSDRPFLSVDGRRNEVRCGLMVTPHPMDGTPREVVMQVAMLPEVAQLLQRPVRVISPAEEEDVHIEPDAHSPGARDILVCFDGVGHYHGCTPEGFKGS